MKVFRQCLCAGAPDWKAHQRAEEVAGGRKAVRRMAKILAEVFPCEMCGAGIGAACTTPDGRVIEAYVHTPRRNIGGPVWRYWIAELVKVSERAEARARSVDLSDYDECFEVPKRRLAFKGQVFADECDQRWVVLEDQRDGSYLMSLIQLANGESARALNVTARLTPLQLGAWAFIEPEEP